MVTILRVTFSSGSAPSSETPVTPSPRTRHGRRPRHLASFTEVHKISTRLEVLRTSTGPRPRSPPAKMTLNRHNREDFAAMHRRAYVLDCGHRLRATHA